MNKKVSSEKVIKDIHRRTRTKYSSEEKISIVLDGIRAEVSPAKLCRRESISSNLYYRWSKDFLEAGKKRLQGDTVREASSQEVTDLKKEIQEQDKTLFEGKRGTKPTATHREPELLYSEIGKLKVESLTGLKKSPGSVCYDAESVDRQRICRVLGSAIRSGRRVPHHGLRTEKARAG